MKKIINNLKYLPVVFPFVFSLLFFGYLPPKYDIVLYTDNIIGEGICQTYTNATTSFSPSFQRTFYCGSELKKATIPGYNYDVSHFRLTFSDVSEVEIEGFDLRVFNTTIAHYSLVERTPVGHYGNLSTSISEDGHRVHFTFDNPAEGTTIAIASHFAPFWFWVAYFGVLMGASAIISSLFAYVITRLPILKQPVLGASAIMVTILSGCYFCGSLPYVQYTYFLLSWILMLAVALFINALTLPFIGTILSMIITAIAYVANYYVIIFRNKPIMPADLKAINTAVEVMGGYNFTPSLKMILGLLAVVGYAAAIIITWKRNRITQKHSVRHHLIYRGMSLFTASLFIILGVNTQAFKTLNSFAWDAALLKSFHEEGMVLTFINNALHARVQQPDGYSIDVVNDYLASYVDENHPGIQPTRIIMIMNEAFSDLRTVGLTSDIDVMPSIDSFDANTIEGDLYVSIFGGGTCNTEFEGLTGNTLAFLSPGAYPYTENVTEPLFSLASYFKGLNYKSEAFHANEAQNWNRDTVYPNLGFSVFHDINDYKETLVEFPYLHKLPADQADYMYIEAVDSMMQSQPHFLFNVTMQNHSSYERWEDVECAASVELYGSELYPDAQIYLSLIKASDNAVKKLIEQYQDSSEPTMIIFFGDHQPGLPAFAQREIYTDVDSYLDWYKTKFFIWTNYETEAEHDVAISANYLPWLILERGNFSLPPYVQMLKELHESYPIISAMGVVDADGNVYGSVNDVLDDPLIRKYQYIQYANLFDEIDPAWFEVK